MRRGAPHRGTCKTSHRDFNAPPALFGENFVLCGGRQGLCPLTPRLFQKAGNQNIDGGKAFNWGRISADYAKFRDIYPPEF